MADLTQCHLEGSAGLTESPVVLCRPPILSHILLRPHPTPREVVLSM